MDPLCAVLVAVVALGALAYWGLCRLLGWALSELLVRLLAEQDNTALGLHVRLAADGCPQPLHRLYPILRRLERQGRLESYEVAEAMEERGGRPRRYYRVSRRV